MNSAYVGITVVWCLSGAKRGRNVIFSRFCSYFSYSFRFNPF